MMGFTPSPHTRRDPKWGGASGGLLVCLLILLLPDLTYSGFLKRVNYQPTYMTADELIAYFRSFLSKASSFDPANEEHYSPDVYAEDLHHKIDNLMPSQLYSRWLQKTKAITDGSILPNSYLNSINAPCAKSSVFNQTLASMLKTWDGDRTVAANEVEQFHRDNERTPASHICNRFKGLTCQYKRALNLETDQGMSWEPTDSSTCQCGGDPENIGFFKEPPLDTSDTKKAAETNGQRYPEGCYVRPWKTCKHLSAVDALFKDAYTNYHNSLENERRVLAQMVFPVARSHRCKQGTYCFDLVPGFKKPICWCNANNNKDKACMENKQNLTGYQVPLLGSSELLYLRKNFMKLIIPASDSKTICATDFNDDIQKLMENAGEDPTTTGSVEIMKKIVQSKRKNLKICDFREALLCDKKTRTCVGNLNCGPGKVHLGQGVCAINNGFPCQSNEDCVVNARCKYFRQVKDSACICEQGYGDQCLLQNKPFFGSRFLPMVSGYQGNEFIEIQTEMDKILETWEDAMSLKLGDKCDSSLDKDAMAVVEYFGDLETYDKMKGLELLSKAKRMGRDGSVKMCKYTDFLRCDPLHDKCVPIEGKKMVTTMNALGEPTISVVLNPDQNCEPEIPQIFTGFVKFTCVKGYLCQKAGSKEYCLPDCESPFAPKMCKEKSKPKEAEVRVDTEEWNVIEERSEPIPPVALMDQLADGMAVSTNKTLTLQGRQSGLLQAAVDCSMKQYSETHADCMAVKCTDQNIEDVPVCRKVDCTKSEHFNLPQCQLVDCTAAINKELPVCKPVDCASSTTNNDNVPICMAVDCNDGTKKDVYPQCKPIDCTDSKTSDATPCKPVDCATTPTLPQCNLYDCTSEPWKSHAPLCEQLDCTKQEEQMHAPMCINKGGSPSPITEDCTLNTGTTAECMLQDCKTSPTTKPFCELVNCDAAGPNANVIPMCKPTNCIKADTNGVRDDIEVCKPVNCADPAGMYKNWPQCLKVNCEDTENQNLPRCLKEDCITNENLPQCHRVNCMLPENKEFPQCLPVDCSHTDNKDLPRCQPVDCTDSENKKLGQCACPISGQVVDGCVTCTSTGTPDPRCLDCSTMTPWDDKCTEFCTIFPLAIGCTTSTATDCPKNANLPQCLRVNCMDPNNVNLPVCKLVNCAGMGNDNIPICKPVDCITNSMYPQCQKIDCSANSMATQCMGVNCKVSGNKDLPQCELVDCTLPGNDILPVCKHQLSSTPVNCLDPANLLKPECILEDCTTNPSAPACEKVNCIKTGNEIIPMCKPVNCMLPDSKKIPFCMDVDCTLPENMNLPRCQAIDCITNKDLPQCQLVNCMDTNNANLPQCLKIDCMDTKNLALPQCKPPVDCSIPTNSGDPQCTTDPIDCTHPDNAKLAKCACPASPPDPTCPIPWDLSKDRCIDCRTSLTDSRCMEYCTPPIPFDPMKYCPDCTPNPPNPPSQDCCTLDSTLQGCGLSPPPDTDCTTNANLPQCLRVNCMDPNNGNLPVCKPVDCTSSTTNNDNVPICMAVDCNDGTKKDVYPQCKPIDCKTNKDATPCKPVNCATTPVLPQCTLYDCTKEPWKSHAPLCQPVDCSDPKVQPIAPLCLNAGGTPITTNCKTSSNAPECTPQDCTSSPTPPPICGLVDCDPSTAPADSNLLPFCQSIDCSSITDILEREMIEVCKLVNCADSTKYKDHPQCLKVDCGMPENALLPRCEKIDCTTAANKDLPQCLLVDCTAPGNQNLPQCLKINCADSKNMLLPQCKPQVDCSIPTNSGDPQCTTPPVDCSLPSNQQHQKCVMVNCQDPANDADPKCAPCPAVPIDPTCPTPCTSNDRRCLDCTLTPTDRRCKDYCSVFDQMKACPDCTPTSSPSPPSPECCKIDPTITGCPVLDCMDPTNEDKPECACPTSATTTPACPACPDPTKKRCLDCTLTPTDSRCKAYCSVFDQMKACPDCTPTSSPSPPSPECCKIDPQLPNCTPTPKVPLKLGNPCNIDDDDCDKEKFLKCVPVDSDRTKKQGACKCLQGTFALDDDKPCAIPFDGPCAQDGPNIPDGYPADLQCYGNAKCQMINDNPFCRADDIEDTPMFLSPENAKKLKERFAQEAEAAARAGGGDDQGSSSSNGLHCTNMKSAAVTGFTIIATFFWTVNGDFI